MLNRKAECQMDVPTTKTTDGQSEWNEMEWLRAAVNISVFDFLYDTKEDIYTRNDGKPFSDETQGCVRMVFQ